jgi:hypothetical protein
VNLGRFRRRHGQALEPVTFVPIRKAFKAQRMIRLNRDVSGWVGGDKRTRKKWSLSAGKEYAIDEDRAREFIGKGYAEPVGWDPNLSDDERAELEAQVTTIGMGG